MAPVLPFPPTACPSCGGSLTVDTTAEKVVEIAPAFYVVGSGPLQQRRVRTTVAFCNDCEYAVERGSR